MSQSESEFSDKVAPRYCVKCKKRRLSERIDPHRFCDECRGQTCITEKCDECMTWNNIFHANFVRVFKKRKASMLQRREVRAKEKMEKGVLVATNVGPDPDERSELGIGGIEDVFPDASEVVMDDNGVYLRDTSASLHLGSFDTSTNTWTGTNLGPSPQGKSLPKRATVFDINTNPAAGDSPVPNAPGNYSGMFNELLSKMSLLSDKVKTLSDKVEAGEKKKVFKRPRGKKRKAQTSERDLGTTKSDISSVPLPTGESVSNPVVGSWPYSGDLAVPIEQGSSVFIDRSKGLLVPVGNVLVGESAVTSNPFIPGATVLTSSFAPLSVVTQPIQTPEGIATATPAPVVNVPLAPAPEVPAPSAPLPRDPSPVPGPSKPRLPPKRPRSFHDSSEGYDRQSDYSFSGDEIKEKKDWKTKPKRSKGDRDDFANDSDASSAARPPLDDKSSKYCRVLRKLKEAYPREFQLKPAPSPKGLLVHAMVRMEDDKPEEPVRYLLPWSLGVRQSLESVDIALAKQVKENRSTVSFAPLGITPRRRTYYEVDPYPALALSGEDVDPSAFIDQSKLPYVNSIRSTWTQKELGAGINGAFRLMEVTSLAEWNVALIYKYMKELSIRLGPGVIPEINDMQESLEVLNKCVLDLCDESTSIMTNFLVKKRESYGQSLTRGLSQENLSSLIYGRLNRDFIFDPKSVEKVTAKVTAPKPRPPFSRTQFAGTRQRSTWQVKSSPTPRRSSSSSPSAEFYNTPSVRGNRRPFRRPYGRRGGQAPRSRRK